MVLTVQTVSALSCKMMHFICIFVIYFIEVVKLRILTMARRKGSKD